MSATLYPIISVPCIGRDELKNLIDSVSGNGAFNERRLFETITGRYGWRPAYADEPDPGINIWGYEQKMVFDLEMPDGKVYEAYSRPREEDGSYEPLVLCPKDWPRGFALTGFQREEDGRIRVTYADCRELYDADPPFIAAFVPVGRHNGSSLFLFTDLPPEERDYLETLCRRCFDRHRVGLVVIQKQTFLR